MVKILINGINGRMGQQIKKCCREMSGVEFVAGVDIDDSLEDNLNLCDCVIDFSIHQLTKKLLQNVINHNKALVIGTTGHDSEEIKLINEASKSIPIVFAPNFSVGVNTLFWLTEKTSSILGSNFDIEVVEMHHNKKTDSPSGTARRLGEILADSINLDYNKDVKHGRVGDVGARSKREIGMHAIRGGDVVGDHTVIFAADGERVELTHKASSRDTFANGSLRAAKWLIDEKKKSGLFSMQDVLGL